MAPGKSATPLKLALFNLQKYVKEEEFSVEFMMRGGTRTLIRLIERTEGGLSGNSLAVSNNKNDVGMTAKRQYALQGIRGLLEFEAVWADLDDTLIDRLLVILVTVQQTNVLRPATAIIRKLVISSPRLDQRAKVKGKGRVTEGVSTDTGVKNWFGFDRVWTSMQVLDVSVEGPRSASGVFKVLSKRLEGTGDLELVAQKFVCHISKRAKL